MPLLTIVLTCVDRCLECANLPDQSDGPSVMDSLSALADLAHASNEDALPSVATISQEAAGDEPSLATDPSAAPELSCHERLDEANNEEGTMSLVPPPLTHGVPSLAQQQQPRAPPQPQRSTRALMPLVEFPSNVQQAASNLFNMASVPSYTGYYQHLGSNKENSYPDQNAMSVWKSMHQWNNTITTGIPTLPPPKSFEKKLPQPQAPYFPSFSAAISSQPHPSTQLSTQDSSDGEGALVPIGKTTGLVPDSFIIP